MRTNIEIDDATMEAAMKAGPFKNYRSLRAAGITIRNSIDVLIAAFCIDRGYLLLHRDHDFEAFEAHRGLRAWKH